MEAYAQALNIAIPVFLILIIVEAIVARYKGLQVNRGPDAISSLSSGITNVVKDVLGLSVVVVSYSWLVEHIKLVELKATWAIFLAAFIAKDFAGYWVHRLEHEINFLWNRHIIHHSSEEYNLSCALRQSISSVLSFAGLFMLPAALLGVPSEVIALIAPIHLFMQFWYHTRIIGKLGFLEKILVTPSHHRVHHAMNPEYIDKNYSQIFIIWDKLFGTFQPELEDVPPVYGVKRPVKTWNPILINFQHFWLLLQDAWRTTNWKHKFLLWFKPTGWRPPDVAEKYPVKIVEDFSHFEKYDSHPSDTLLYWSWFQLIITLLLMYYMFNQIANIPFDQLLLYGLFLFMSVYSYTTLLDKNKWALLSEAIKASFGWLLIFLNNGWFGIDQYLTNGSWVVATYLATSLLVTMWFVASESKPRSELSPADK